MGEEVEGDREGDGEVYEEGDEGLEGDSDADEKKR
jgi:hypothetical protein